MKTIAYFITDSGFGHITRSIAIIAKILNNSDYKIIIVSNTDQNNHAKIALLDYGKRVSFYATDTDANSVFYTNSLEVDNESTMVGVRKYMDNLDSHVETTYDFLKESDISLVITDISILGIMVAKKLNVKVLGISNYTWYNRFKSFGLDQDILDFYQQLYNEIDLFLKFKFSDDMSGINCPFEEVGLVCRDVDMISCNDYKHSYWPAIYLSIGQVEKKKEIFEVDFPQGTIFTTGTIKINGSTHLFKLPKNISHTQDYIAASSLALIKGGWSTVAECLILGVPFGILEQGDTEDIELVNKLFDEKLAFKTTEAELRNFNIKNFNIKATTLVKQKFTNDSDIIANRIIRYCEE